MTIAEILALPAEERRAAYGVTGNRIDSKGNPIDIGTVWIKKSAYKGDIEDNFTEDDKFSGYGNYSFVWHRSDKETMERADNGSTPQIWNMPYIITGELEINFDLISIDDYRRIMKLIYGRNCFKVKTYDIVYDRMIINEMYFQPDELPKIFTMANLLHGLGVGNDESLDLIGIQSHKTKMVGTGNDNAQGRYFGSL